MYYQNNMLPFVFLYLPACLSIYCNKVVLLEYFLTNKFHLFWYLAKISSENLTTKSEITVENNT